MKILIVFLITLSLGLSLNAYGQNTDTTYNHTTQEFLDTINELLNPENNKPNQAVILIQSNTEWTANISGSELGSSTKNGTGNAKYSVTCEGGIAGLAQGNVQKNTEHGYLVVTVIQYGNIIGESQFTTTEYGIAHSVGECINNSEYKENLNDYEWIQIVKDTISEENRKLEAIFNVTLSFDNFNIQTTLSGKTLNELHDITAWDEGLLKTWNQNEDIWNYNSQAYHYQISNSPNEEANGYYVAYQCDYEREYLDEWHKETGNQKYIETWKCYEHIKLHDS